MSIIIMILYKCLHSDRVDVLKNYLIRTDTHSHW